MDPGTRLRKTSRWLTEQRAQKVIALNRKEENVLQQKLDQFQRKQNQLRREHDYEIQKTAKALKARKDLPFDAGKSKSPLRRNSSPSVEPTRAMVYARRRHSIACLPAARIEKEPGINKKANEDVLFEIENNFKFLSIAFGNKSNTPTSSNVVKLPEIKTSSPHGSRSDIKPVLMRRRHSDAVRHGMQRLRGENRHTSLANIRERFA